jgi:S-adenosylmethionine synthetase
MTTTATPVRTHLAEDVLPGHPDRVADTIAESIVDQAVAWDDQALVGVEVAVHREAVFVTGRVAGTRVFGNTQWHPVELDLKKIVRKVFTAAGYTGQWAVKANVVTDLDLGRLDGEEREIRQYADDQNLVVGYAEASEATGYLPAGPFAARRIRERLTVLGAAHRDLLGPDGKVLIRLEEHDGAYRWRTLNVSLHHARGATDYETLYALVLPALEQASSSLEDALPGLAASFDDELVHLNGAGDFSCGGTFGDNGLSGKKLVVDGYGPGVPIGGGALCGEDPHKIDRIGALSARQLAVRLVRDAAAGRARVTLGWLPGRSTPDVLIAEVDGVEWSEARIQAAIPSRTPPSRPPSPASSSPRSPGLTSSGADTWAARGPGSGSRGS